VELRVPGIGGPSPESVLGCEPGYAVPSWRSEPRARSMVRHAAGNYDVHAYDWRPLTSGSRSFVVWPLLLPFTLANVAGWMGPSTSTLRGRLHRYITVLLGLAMTANCVVWLVVAGLSIWVKVLKPKDLQPWPFWLAVISATLAMGVLVLAATFMAVGYERFRINTWPARPRKGLWGGGIHADLRDPQFYDNANEHEFHWRVHIGVAVLAMAGTIFAVVSADGVRLPQRGLNSVILVAGAAPLVAVGLLALIALPPDHSRPFWSRFVGAGAGSIGVLLLGGLVLSALIAFVGPESIPPGPAAMIYDVYGWSLFGALVFAVLLVLFRLQTPSAAEASPVGKSLLGSVMARFRARAVLAIGGFDLIIPVIGLVLLVGSATAVIVRWFVRDDGESWRLTPTLPVQLGRVTFVFLLTTLVINLVKSRGNPAALQRIGNVWDILTFWPRTFHPFAVRPYAERAVPELREFIVTRPNTAPLVIAAHSQGTVLTYAALLPVARADLPPISLVTFGSPLRSLYAKAFPSCFTADDVEALRSDTVCHWSNLFRCTDHVGRAVFSTDADALREFGEAQGAAVADLPLRDPATGTVVLGHNAYWMIGPVRQAVLDGASELAVMIADDREN
jgi:hypothetical protein